MKLKEIEDSDVDIILLAGGTNGGNKQCILHNAKMIINSNLNVPIVVAGNKSANDELRKMFTEANLYFSITENVMPQLNSLNVEPAREEIRKCLWKKITDAKGLSNADFVNGILMLTPAKST